MAAAENTDGNLVGFAECSLRHDYDESWAHANGYHEIASDAALHNATSIAAHRALGFREAIRNVHFAKSLK